MNAEFFELAAVVATTLDGIVVEDLVFELASREIDNSHLIMMAAQKWAISFNEAALLLDALL